jgi:putative ABC transport system substrate-binding protein
LGWIEGRNVEFVRRFADSKLERLPELARDLARLNVSVIVALANREGRAAKAATATIPIVVPFAVEPVEQGLVASLARPGGNVTGLNYAPSMELYAKRIQLLTEITHSTHIALLWNPDGPLGGSHLKAAREAAVKLPITLLPVEVRSPGDFAGAFSTMMRERIGGVLFVATTDLIGHRRQVAELAIKHHLPMVSVLRMVADAGALLSYGPSAGYLLQRAADYVDRILRGAKPSDLPIEQPTKFEFVVNLKTAKALGVTIPPSILVQADEIIQ